MKIASLLGTKSNVSDNVVTEDRILHRYRLIMGVIGILYPLWRFMVYFFEQAPGSETWTERGFIGILFLFATLATFIHPWFRRNVATLFDCVAGIWTLQVFFLIWRSDMDPDYMQMGLITIFCVGGSFLNQRGMLQYYLLCLVLTGYTVFLHPEIESTTFFFGVLIALTVSYICFNTLIAVFRDLRETQTALVKRTKEFEELSAAVQTLFLPNATYVKERGFELAGYYRPATACGGDWWSFFVVHEESVALFVGDITGHGPGSAMMTASVASYLKAIRNNSSGKAVPDILQELNNYLLELQGNVESSSRYLMTMAAIEVNLKTQRLQLWSAGAPFPFLTNDSGKTHALGSSGNPLGLSQKLNLGYEDVQVTKGDRIFLYTDGITEMKITEDRQFGERRLTKLIQATREMKPQEAVRAIEADLDSQKFTSEQEDDFTFVVLDVG